jgi:ubiquinone/menaquinone biosynthesis C-methylase UbiE
MSEFWDKLPSSSPNRVIENFHKAEENFIVNFIKKGSDNPLILDLGCGTGRCLKTLYKNGFRRLYGIDISSKMIRKCKSLLPNSVILQHDFRERLPFTHDFFNFILITGNALTGSGFTEYDVVLKQAYRVLKRGGFLILGEYNAEFMSEQFVKNYYGKFYPKEIQFKKFDKKNKIVYVGTAFSHWVTKNELKELLESQNFKIVEIKRKGIGFIAVAKK